MEFDFTTILDRHGKDSLAADKIPFEGVSVEEGFSSIPMWVADMSFPAGPFIVDAIRKRLEMPNFGYFAPPEEYFEAIIRWHRERKDDSGLTKEAIGYENGVLGGVRSAVCAFSSPGESILVHSPVYVGFTGTLNGLGRRMVFSDLKRDEAGIWRMDYEDMDRKLKENHIHLAIFCYPHNPCGRVWERWEIEKAMALFKKYDVYVVSDEIWSDIILSGKHIPVQSVSEDAKMRTVAFYAPSKTFNLAGLVGSYHIIRNRYLRDRVRKAGSMSHYNGMNVLSMHALIGAYTAEGGNWVNQMCQVIDQNITMAEKALTGIHGVRFYRPEGTYMIFPDFREWCEANGKTMDQLEKACWDVGVALQDGRMFHGAWNLRINLAMPSQYVEEAFHRLKQYVFQ